MIMLKGPRALFLFLIVLSVMPRYYPAPAWAGGPKESMGEEIRISVLKGTEEEDPGVTWDGQNYLVLWQSSRTAPDNYDVYAAGVSPEGKVLDPQGFAVSTAPSNQIFIDVAWGKGEYLAVWQDLRSHQRWEIYGARFRPDGTVFDAEGIPIAVGKRNARHPQVAWDGKNFLVVWMEENEGRGWDVAGVRIGPDGTVLDGERILIATAPGDQASPALAWGQDQYLVVWMENGGISGARVDSSGKVLDPQGFVLSRSSRGAGYPTVAWGKKHFVVIWGDQPAPPAAHSISGVRVSTSGQVIDGTEMTIARSSNLQTFPSVRCAGEECLVVWEEEQSAGRPRQGIESIIRDVRGAFLDLSRNPVIPQGVMISPKAIGNHFAKVATDGHKYLVTWKDYRTGTAASLGRLVTPSR
jgi:hypothetical protein